MKMTFRLSGLDCAHCAAKIEKEVAKLSGVTKASVSFMTQKMTVEAQDGLCEEIAQKATDAVHKYEPHVAVRRI